MNLRPVLLLLVLTLAIQACSVLRPSERYQKPEVSYQSFSVQEFNRDGITFLFDFDIHNPNRREITSEAYSYALQVNGNQLASGENQETITLEGRTTTRLQVPVSFGFRELGQTGRSLLRSDSLSYVLEADLALKVPIMGTREIPVKAEGTLPPIKMPQLRYRSYDVGQLSLSGADLAIYFEIYNPNSFGFTMKSLAYTISVLGDEIIETTFDETLRLEAGAREQVTVNLRLDAATLGRSAIQLLMGRSAFEYSFKGKGDFEVDLPKMKGKVSVPFEDDGELYLN